MAKLTYGSWATTADAVTGELSWTSVDGKYKIVVDMPAACGITQDEWAALTPALQWVASYGAKQKISDGLAGKAAGLTNYRTLLEERVQAFVLQEHVTGSQPYACEAIARIRGLPLSEVRTAWADLSPEVRAQRYALPTVQAMVALIESEVKTARAKAVVGAADGDDGLGDFGPRPAPDKGKK